MTEPTTEPATDPLTPTRTGYAEVDGMRIYHESYGEGPPLVLLHGGLMTIDLNFATLIPTLAQTHTVIGVEAQGHGRTNNIDREITYPNLAGDVVAVLDQLGLEQATVFGHSMGGGTALELLVNHPDRVRAAVVASASVRKDGSHPDLSDPSTYATSSIMPTQDDFVAMSEAYARLSPHPEQFESFMAQLGAMDSHFEGWTDEQLATISCPVLLVQGDNDFTLNAHAAVMKDLIPGSTLAILPATTHMQVTRQHAILLPILAQFFALNAV